MGSLGSDGQPELTGIETGVWLVHTRDSVYVVDFAARTLARMPIPGADFRSTDRVRPLRSVEICRIGEPAFGRLPPTIHRPVLSGRPGAT